MAEPDLAADRPAVDAEAVIPAADQLAADERLPAADERQLAADHSAAGERQLAADERQLAAYGTALAEALDAALPAWVEGLVVQRMRDWSGGVPEQVAAGATEAGRRARADVGPRLRQLLATDVDAQRTTPLALVRRAVPYATEVLAGAGVPGVVRDEVAERAFPDDVYDLAPATLADVRPDLAEPGLHWGAAKAHVVLARRRAEGRR